MATHISKSRHAQSLAPQFHIDDKIFRFPPAGTPTGNRGPARAGLFFVRPAGRTYLEVKVLYTPGKGKC